MDATTGAEGVRAVFGAETDTAMAGRLALVFSVSVSVSVAVAATGSDFVVGSIDAADGSIASSAASTRSCSLLTLLYAPRNRGEVGITGLLISFGGKTG